MHVTFVTSNPHKYREVREILRPFGLETAWLRKDLPEPQASDLREVVRAKLQHVPKRRTVYLVEDSGIFLAGLSGFPGVYSKYVYDSIGLEGILRLLEGKRRAAVFRTVAGVRIGPRSWTVEGRITGTIASRPRGTNGFGYDHLFIPSGSAKTYAEMSRQQKAQTSHRARAVRSAARRLLSLAAG